ncbi:MAG: excinuclease ABC subunit UvrC [Bacillota bacterium]|nr:excinuclease ABC subunit UvrC [Bacillota bacterium]
MPEREGRPPDLAAKLELLPDAPGVYLFHDAAGKPLYVGKARSLRQRVRSYFAPSRDLGPRKENMVAQVQDVDYIVTATPVEALILEANLIKRHHPKYNITLRDDKQYPYVRVGLGEDYPGVTLVRARGADDARYFGPYTQSRALRGTLQALRRVFPYRTCRRVQERPRACLDHFIGRCLAPCLGRVTPEEYGEMISRLILFLSGRGDEVSEQLEQRMRTAAGELAFESAAAYRDQLRAFGSILAGQKIESSSLVDRDVVAVATDPVEACAQVFFFRRGKLVGRESFPLRGAEPGREAEAMSAFLTQFYSVAAETPREVLLSTDVEDRGLVEAWLTGLRGRKVSLAVPRRGEGARLMEMALRNAGLALEERRRRRGSEDETVQADLIALADALGLEDYPQRIECYDVSNISGRDPAASMVVFEGGKPRKEDYRHFRLRTAGPDDYAMMREVLHRRLRHRRTGTQGASTEADSFDVLPDLIIVDGGRGHVQVASEVLQDEGLGTIAVFGLAKEQEILYPPGGAPPVVMPAGSGALFTLMRLRDEAHRFALAYHRKLRARRSLKSVLDGIPGIGPARRTALLKHFGSGKAIAAASLEDLAAVSGLTAPAARAVHDWFHPADKLKPVPDQEGTE